MIEEIKLKKAATFDDETIIPKKINYFYGFNGSGKSTIGKIIKNQSEYENCSVKFRDNKETEVLIYNQNFVEDNFYETSSIDGIFTLGKNASDAERIIDETKEKLNKVKEKLQSLEKTKGEQNKSKARQEEKILDKCWNIKQKYAPKFKEALSGYIGTKEKFKEKCLNTKIDNDSLKTAEELEIKYKNLYKQELNKKIFLQEINYEILIEIEKNDILNEKIKGNENTTVSELIEKLNNSDWIKKGFNYLKIDDSKCPFCQKKLETDNINKLLEYFDKNYEKKYNELIKIFSNYKEQATAINEEIEKNIELMDNDKKTQLEKELYKFNSIVESNNNLLKNKIENTSNPITLNPTDSILKRINNLIKKENENIIEYNKMVENSENEKQNLKDNIWNLFVDELKEDIDDYNKDIKDINKAIENINEKIHNEELEIINYTRLINEKESEITGIIPTIVEINKILESFGFTNFKLAESEKKGKYKIVRIDGSNVKKTLSEGEYRFITFLYFYHLIKGSREKDGVIKDKIIVIDDPISSLDSNTVFIVSTLVKDITNKCLKNDDGISQVFVLTHNIYFYKEITYKNGRNQKKESNKQYYVITKRNGVSTVQSYEENPIKTTYKLLWDELYDDKEMNRATIFNTMRRILEYYFNIIGCQDYEECINKFEGEEKIICKSLLAFINDNSHYISDDFSIIFSDDTIIKYKKVFKKIFENLGHIAHYNMMMEIENDTQDKESNANMEQGIKEEMNDFAISAKKINHRSKKKDKY